MEGEGVEKKEEELGAGPRREGKDGSKNNAANFGER